MAEGRDEVEAAVYAVVLDVLAVEAALVPEVLLELLVDVVGHGLPAGAEAHGGIFSLQGNAPPRQHPKYCAGLFINTTKLKRDFFSLCSLNIFIFWSLSFFSG